MDKTSNYKRFKFLPSNRPLNKQLVEDLVSSIKQKNLLEFRPILVDEHFGIIDGQHRLMAAQNLGVEVYYQIKKGASVADMLTLNAVQCKWTWTDFLNAYVAEKNQNYIKLKAFMEKHSMILPCALAVFELKAKTEKDAAIFKQGKFIYPKEESEFNAKAECFSEICQLIKTKTIEKYNFRLNKSFCYAFCTFMNAEEMNYMTFLKKLMVRLDRVKRCVTEKDYLLMLVSIYNYKNQQPIYADRFE